VLNWCSSLHQYATRVFCMTCQVVGNRGVTPAVWLQPAATQLLQATQRRLSGLKYPIRAKNFNYVPLLAGNLATTLNGTCQLSPHAYSRRPASRKLRQLNEQRFGVYNAHH
jgi:hypothetical protein